MTGEGVVVVHARLPWRLGRVRAVATAMCGEANTRTAR